jgi:hypothetical protein
MRGGDRLPCRGCGNVDLGNCGELLAALLQSPPPQAMTKAQHSTPKSIDAVVVAVLSVTSHEPATRYFHVFYHI